MQEKDLENSVWSHSGKVGKVVFYLTGYGVIICLTGLSMWAVAQVQLASRPDGEIIRLWYLAVFIALELWVVTGLILANLCARQGAWLAVLVAFALWVPALGLSAMQESRFHLLYDSKIEAAAAPELTRRDNSEKQIAELETSLALFARPTRSVTAIKTELAGYEARRDAARYPTRITALKSELAAATAHADLLSELATARQALVETASLATENMAARKVGQIITVPLLNWVIPSHATVWILIATMMAIKALGPWLLFRPLLNAANPSARRKPPPEEAKWVEVKDRHGQPKKIRVFSSGYVP